MPEYDKEQFKRTHILAPYEDDDIVVHFIGDDAFSGYRQLTDHKNPGYEICLVLYGKGVFKIQDRAFPVTEGQLFMTKAPEVHSGMPSQENPFRILYFCFLIRPEAVRKHPFWSDIDKTLSSVEYPVIKESFGMESVHRDIMKELATGSLFLADAVGSLIKFLIILTARNYAAGSISPGTAKKQRAGLSDNVIGYISEHLESGFDLESLGRHLHYSVSYITRTFRKQTGFTVMNYYSFARLERARQLLLGGGETVSSVSERLGFSSIHHFSKAFKILYGASPARYLQSHAGGMDQEI